MYAATATYNTDATVAPLVFVAATAKEAEAKARYHVEAVYAETEAELGTEFWTDAAFAALSVEDGVDSVYTDDGEWAVWAAQSVFA